MTHFSSTKAFALAAVAGLTLGIAPFTATTASAATTTVPIAQKCINVVPAALQKMQGDRDVNLVRAGDTMTITTPDSVNVGDEYSVKVDYRPELIKGVQQGVKVIAMHDIVLRMTLNNPDSFVTAKILGEGKNITPGHTPKFTLVGGNTLVMDGLDVTLNGEDTMWAPPVFEIVMKATAPGKVDVFHQVNEGPGGEFNNPANWITMNNEVSLAGINSNLGMHCQAVSKDGSKAPDSLASVMVTGTGTAAKPADGKKSASVKTTVKNGKVVKVDEKTGKTVTSTTDENGLTIADTDVTTSNTSSSSFGWVIAVVVILLLAAAGGIGYGVYRGVQKKKNKGDA